MADVTPSSFATYGDPLTMIPCVPAGTAPGAGTPAFVRKHALKHRCFYFADIDTGDTWTSRISGIVGVAFARDEFVAAEFADARLTTAATGLITFTTSGSDASGFLHVWSRG